MGRTDVPLCSEGYAQLEQCMETGNYPCVEKVYASPLERRLQTAAYLYPNTPLVPVQEMTELDLGEFEGRALEELKDQPEFVAWMRDNVNNPPPNGETNREFVERLVQGMDKIVQDMMENGIFEAAVVTHAGAIMTMMALMAFPRKPMGEWDMPNGSGFTVLITPQLWMNNRVFEAFGNVPVSKEAVDYDWLEQKYYESGEDENE